jgi:arylsulfatase A-like enzyme
MLDSIGGAGYDLTLRGRFDVGAGVMDNCGTVWKDSSDCTGDGFHGGPDLSILTRAADIRKPTKGDPMKDVVDDDADPYGNDQAHIDEGVAWFNTHKVNPDVPFFFWVGVYAPHAPFDTNSTYLAAVNASAVDVPPSARVPVADMHPYDSYMSISKDALADYNDTQIMSVRTSYWGAAEEADQMMGRILAAALASRHLDNTIVLYTSDHGEMAMEHRQDFKSSLYEPSVRVPLIIAGFNTSMPIPKGKVVTDAVSHLDIYPTLVEIAGGTLGYGVRGQSLVPYLTTPEPTAAPMAPMRNYAAFEYHGNMVRLLMMQWDLIAPFTVTAAQ